MKDKIHQPYRTVLIPGLDQVLEEVVPAKHLGLCGICLSGAGPTILCLATEGFEEIAKSVIDILQKRVFIAIGNYLTWHTMGQL